MHNRGKGQGKKFCIVRCTPLHSLTLSFFPLMQASEEEAHYLEEFAQRLNQLQLHVRGQASDIVVGLDSGRRPLVADGLNHIGVKRPLEQEGGVWDFGCFFLEALDEHVPDDFALLFRVIHSM